MSSDAQIQHNKKRTPLSKQEYVLFSKLPCAFNANPSPEMTVRMMHSFMFFAETGTFISPLAKNTDKEKITSAFSLG